MNSEQVLSFEEALRASEELLQDLEENPESTELLLRLRSMLSQQASCRAFFVILLTGEFFFSDNPSQSLLEALQESSEVPELLSKNLVMSTATEITHKRKGDLENAAASASVAKRSGQIIRMMQSKSVRTKLLEMKASIKLGSGVFAEFLRRWQYDQEQLQASLAAIESLTMEQA